MAAARQKPPELLQGRSSKYRGTRTLALVRDDSRPVPACPPRLRKSARDAWETFWRSPMAQLIKDDSDLEALSDWAYSISERDRLRQAMRGKEVIQGKSSLVANPLMRLIAQHTAQINRYRDQFGMNPLARMRLGIAIGEAANVLADLEASLGEAEPEVVDLSEFDDAIEVPG